MKLDIYNLSLDKHYQALESLRKEDKKVILQFLDQCSAEGLSVARIKKYLYCLKVLSNLSEKPLIKNKKQDLIKLLSNIERSNYSEWTKRDYKLTIKKFYRWLGKDKMVEWIKLTMKKNNVKLPEDLLTEDEVLKMIETATNIRDKAMISVLYEAGLRIGECLSLQIKNVLFDEFGAVIKVAGKTGERRVRLISSSPLLAKWLDAHPNKNDPNAWLWCRIGLWKYRKEPLTYRGASKMLQNVAEKAGIKKRIYPHLFRHSRATYLARHLTEAQLCNYLGWVQGSDMAATYVHLSGRDQDDAILKVFGLKKEEDKESKLKPKKCFRCGTMNSPTSRYCQKCSLPLNEEERMEYYEIEEKTDYVLDQMMQKEEVRSFLKKVFFEMVKKGEIKIK